MNTFKLDILASNRHFYTGECESLVVPAFDGAYGIQANHANVIMAMVPGELKARIPGEKEPIIAAVSAGIIKIEDNEVSVLADTIERPDEIDETRAQRALERAKEELRIKENRNEYLKATAELERSLNRLKVKKRHR